MISLKVRCDPVTTGVLKHIQALDKKERSCKVNSKGDRDRAGHIAPSTDPSYSTTTPGRRQGKGLIVDAARCRIYGGDLSERRADTQHNRRYDNPAPDHSRRTTSRHRVHHGGGKAEGHGGQDNDHKHDLPC